jgi:hypothetical protein
MIRQGRKAQTHFRDAARLRAHRFRLAAFVLVLLGTTSLAMTPATLAGGSPGSSVPAATSDSTGWVGPDGKPLPFQSDEELKEFLRTAKVVTIEDIPTGTTKPRKVLLEKDGIQAYSVFRDVDIYQKKVTIPRRGVRKHWRDCCRFECAAYELARLLGLENIPPVVRRKIKGKKGTLQIWLENAMTEAHRSKQKLKPPDQERHQRQWQMVRVFDALIHNDDRNSGNILYDPDWSLWMIDHTRTFPRISDLPQPNLIRQCERELWEALQKLDEASVKKQLGEYLESPERKALLKRREKLIDHIQSMIEQRGEEEVLFALR